jgi:hypothetical protein
MKKAEFDAIRKQQQKVFIEHKVKTMKSLHDKYMDMPEEEKLKLIKEKMTKNPQKKEKIPYRPFEHKITSEGTKMDFLGCNNNFLFRCPKCKCYTEYTPVPKGAVPN